MTETTEDIAIDVAVLKAILPRVEEEMKQNSADHKSLALTMEEIRSTMATKEMFASINLANDNAKRRADGLQYQIAAICGIVFLCSLPGMSGLIGSLLINVLPKLVQ